MIFGWALKLVANEWRDKSNTFNIFFQFRGLMEQEEVMKTHLQKYQAMNVDCI